MSSRRIVFKLYAAKGEIQMKKLVALILVLVCIGVHANAISLIIPGMEAPDFEIQLIDGETFKLSEQRGKVVLLNIWATWCGPCVNEMPDINRLAEDYEDELVVIGVNCGEQEKKVADFVEKNGFGYLFAADPDYMISGMLYPTQTIPYTVIIDSNGIVHQVVCGGGRDMYSVFEGHVLSAIEATAPEVEMLA